ncbi:MAG: hypothetical protein QXD62_03375 [Candidatus Woesearchaeota archaeon]
MKSEDRLKMILSECNPEEAFILSNGIRLHSLKELKEALLIIPSEVYNHHVTYDRNDFANWIRDIFKDYILAERIRKAENKEEAAKIIEKRIEFLEDRLRYLESLDVNKAFKKVWILDFAVGFILGLLFGWLLAIVI